jgi:hypothetical protein
MCPPGDQLLLDPTFRGSDEVLRRENLLPGRDVAALAGEEIKRTCDQLEVQAAAKPQAVLLEELADRLQVPAPGQVGRIFVPAVEHLDPLYIRRIKVTAVARNLNMRRGMMASLSGGLASMGAATPYVRAAARSRHT